MTLFYPDCSNNNWSSAQDAIDFLEQLVPEGFSGMCHKVSEGSYYEDPYWPTVQQWCSHNESPPHWLPLRDDKRPRRQAQTWLGNNGGSIAMLDWEANGGDLSNLTAVVDELNAAGVTVQLGYYPQWYWSQQGRRQPFQPGQRPSLVRIPGRLWLRLNGLRELGRQYRPGLGALRGRDPCSVAIHQQRRHRRFHRRLQRLPRQQHHSPIRHCASSRRWHHGTTNGSTTTS